jgi:hypothetical protein
MASPGDPRIRRLQRYFAAVMNWAKVSHQITTVV